MSKSQKHNESIEGTTIDSKARAADAKPEQNETGPILLAQVLADEFKETTGKAIVGEPESDRTIDGKVSTEPSLDCVFKQFHAANLTALCFSGGGIRSATFGLGILQALAKHGLLDKFDYLSTVSGGGYLGSWMSAWVRRERVKATIDPNLDVKSIPLLDRPAYREPLSAERNVINEARQDRDTGIKAVQKQINCIKNKSDQFPTPEADPLRHLREYSNYMSPRVGLLSADTWTLIAIYLRNLFLNWTIFIPLIAAVLLLPRIFYAVVRAPLFDGRYGFEALAASLMLGSVVVAFVIAKLPSKNPDPGKTKRNTDASVLAIGVLPLVGMAFAVITLWAWNIRTTGAFGGDFIFIADFINFTGIGSSASAFLNRRLSYFILFAVALYIAGYIGHLLFNWFSKGIKTVINLRTILAGLVSSIIGAVILWWAATRILVPENFSTTHDYNLQIYVCFAVPIFLLIFLISATIFVGLASRIITDEDREWLARYGAWILIASVIWIVANTLVLIAPSGLEQLIFMSSDVTGWPKLEASIVSAIGIISGILSLVGGFSEKSLVGNQPVQSKTSKILAVAPKAAAAVFLIFIIVGLAYLTTIVLYYAGKAIADASGSWLGELISERHAEMLNGSSIAYLFVSLAVLSLIGLIMACFVNVNKFSLHGAYRDRLIRAYLGASNFFRQRNSFTGFDDSDNLQLHRLRGQRPFHVINATLNLVGGKNLAWQNRKAASFTMSPLHCGSWLLGYRNTNEYCRNTSLGNCKSLEFCNKRDQPCASVIGDDCKLRGKALRLGTAMAISGAAANPNMGYYSSSVVTFLMSLFNIRLGWWLGNTNEVGGRKSRFGRGPRYFEKQSPSIAVLPLLNETLGRTDQDKRYINVTDGGHFENLGLYEMVLRRCKFIVLSDGAADHEFKYGEISNAIQKCKVDLGVDIKFNDGINIFARKGVDAGKTKKVRYSIADITYPEKGSDGKNLTGYLLYTRPAYYKTEPTDIKHYADANQTFPHQSTGDQMYDEKQFEAYRGLGFLTMEEIIGKNKSGDFEQFKTTLTAARGPRVKTNG